MVGAVLPNENLQRQIDGDAGSREHQRSTGHWVPKDQQLRWWHCQTGSLGLAAMVDHSKQGDSSFFQEPSHVINDPVYRVITLVDHSKQGDSSFFQEPSHVINDPVYRVITWKVDYPIVFAQSHEDLHLIRNLLTS